jgi:tetratricopeptide (TPR) repeat protein
MQGLYSEELFYYKGLCQKKLGEYNIAIEEFEKAVEINPDNKELYMQIGLCLFNMVSLRKQ